MMKNDNRRNSRIEKNGDRGAEQRRESVRIGEIGASFQLCPYFKIEKQRKKHDNSHIFDFLFGHF
jgi:hypothetical protein